MDKTAETSTGAMVDGFVAACAEFATFRANQRPPRPSDTTRRGAYTLLLDFARQNRALAVRGRLALGPHAYGQALAEAMLGHGDGFVDHLALPPDLAEQLQAAAGRYGVPGVELRGSWIRLSPPPGSTLDDREFDPPPRRRSANFVPRGRKPYTRRPPLP